ncbi:MAG: 4Fe-4S binding protein [Candidatus Bathyarchaeota archaeon]|nr:4Fe-4S binding protein [Candidatus Bathyarchaeota archaeon]MDW8040366.1 4Fe-4S binding protein [Nitrososphaerota archaeon]
MRIHINEDLCKGCGICISLCPNKVFAKSEEISSKGVFLPVIIHGDKCIACRICEEHCPDLAIFIEAQDVEK